MHFISIGCETLILDLCSCETGIPIATASHLKILYVYNEHLKCDHISKQQQLSRTTNAGELSIKRNVNLNNVIFKHDDTLTL